MRFLLPLALLAIAMPAMAQTPPPVPQQPLTLERLFASPSLSRADAAPAAACRPDGRLAPCCATGPTIATATICGRSTPPPAQARMLVDSQQGRLRRAIFPKKRRCAASGRGSPASSGIVDYDWAPDGQSILVPIDGDLYLAGLDGNVRRLTNTPETELDAQVSRDRPLPLLRPRPESLRDRRRRDRRAPR